MGARRNVAPRHLARGFTQVNPQFFLSLPRVLSGKLAHLACVGLIYQRTVGWGVDRASIDIQAFTDVTGLTRRAVEGALEELRKKKIIELTRDIRTGAKFYSVAAAWLPERGSSGDPVHCRCFQCRQVVQVDLESAPFVPVPHAFFYLLPKSCAWSELVIVGVILAKTAKWDRTAKVVYSEPASITLRDFTEATGLSRRRAQQAIRKAESDGLITVDPIAGGTHGGNLYSVNPLAFAGLEPRAPRKLTRGEVGANGISGKLKTGADRKQDTEEGGATECHSRKFFAHCPNCATMTLVARISLSVVPHTTRASKCTGPPGGSDPPAVQVDGLETYLWQWSTMIGSEPTSEVCAEFGAALRGAGLAALDDKLMRRRDWIQRNAKSFRALLPMAREVGAIHARFETAHQSRQQNGAARRVELEAENIAPAAESVVCSKCFGVYRRWPSGEEVSAVDSFKPCSCKGRQP